MPNDNPNEDMDDLEFLSGCARDVAGALRKTGTQLVLAESCTAGLVASTLASVPGISEFFCGSAVVYQIPTKLAWLEPDVPIDDENVVSEQTAVAMVTGVLNKTPHANLAAAITGHLGPNADPPDLDGTAWIAIQRRGESAITEHLKLRGPENQPKTEGVPLRLVRQRQASGLLLQRIDRFLRKAFPQQ